MLDLCNPGALEVEDKPGPPVLSLGSAVGPSHLPDAGHPVRMERPPGHRGFRGPYCPCSSAPSPRPPL